MPVIDAHTHLFAPAQRDQRAALCQRDATFAELYAAPAARLASGPDLFSEMAAAGLEGAVAAGFAFAAEQDLRDQAGHLLAVARQSPAVIPLPGVNPALGGWRAYAEEMLAGGARGFGELRPHNQGWDPLGPASHELCDLAAGHGAVLLWHVSEPVGHAYPGKHGGISPVELCLLAQAHPATRMVAAHLGGGLSFFVQMPEIRRALASVWFDTAAASLLYDDGSIARLVDLVGVERVLFGSDYPLLSPGRQLERIRALLASNLAEAVCGGTAANLFSENLST